MNIFTHSTEFIYVTGHGYHQLQRQLETKQQEYVEVRSQRQDAFELSGDGWHDNPEFNRMQQMEVNLNHTIKLLTERINQARIIEVSDDSRNLIQICVGSIVRFKRWETYGDHEKEETWEISGFDETDISSRRLAYNSPLGSALMGMRIGEHVDEQPIGKSLWDMEILQIFRSRKSAGI